MTASPPGGKPPEDSAGHSHDQPNVFAPNAHGEELREYGEGDWQHEVGEFFKHLNQAMSKVVGAAGSGHGDKTTSMKHPLVLAAVITTCVTAGSSLLIHLFQNREAANQRTNELYKSKIDFVGSFGDSFPKSLSTLYSCMREEIWLKCFPVSYAVDQGADPKKPEDAKAFRAKELALADAAWDAHSKDFAEASKARLQEKKLTALCAQALAMFSHEEGADIRALLKNVRAMQDLADDPKPVKEGAPPEKFNPMDYQKLAARLDALHNESNDLFAKVLETLGNQLAGQHN